MLDSNNKSFKATIERIDKRLDLCLIKVHSPKHSYAIIGRGGEIGDKVFMINSENDTPNTYGEGVVENIIRDRDKVVSLIHSATILHGASGSGLFNQDGELIGINTAIYQSLTNAVDVIEIKEFLSNKIR